MIAVFSSPDAAAVVQQWLDAFNVEYVVVTLENGEDNVMSVQVEILPEHLTERVIALLRQPGYLELVDVNALDTTQRQEGTRVWTTGQEARLNERLVRLSNEATPEPTALNPETNRPFKTALKLPPSKRWASCSTV